MSKIIVDRELRAKLNGLSAAIEFCDQSGRTIGHFVPDEEYSNLVISGFSAQITDGELEQLRAQSGGRPLAEIWKSLGQQ